MSVTEETIRGIFEIYSSTCYPLMEVDCLRIATGEMLVESSSRSREENILRALQKEKVVSYRLGSFTNSVYNESSEIELRIVGDSVSANLNFNLPPSFPQTSPDEFKKLNECGSNFRTNILKYLHPSESNQDLHLVPKK